MSLYGHEISEEINVLEAGLDRWLKLDKGEFIGRDALAAVQAVGRTEAKDYRTGDGGARHRSRRVPVLFLDGEQIGEDHVGIAGAVPEDEHCDGAGAVGCRRERSGCAGGCARQSRAREAGAAAVLQAGEEVRWRRLLDVRRVRCLNCRRAFVVLRRWAWAQRAQSAKAGAFNSAKSGAGDCKDCSRG